MDFDLSEIKEDEQSNSSESLSAKKIKPTLTPKQIIDKELKTIELEIKKKGLRRQRIYFLYTRVSDDSYEASLYDQEEMLRVIAKHKGIRFIVLSEEKSGYTTGRELFEEMMSRLENDYKSNINSPENKTFGGILFWKVDRLARNYSDFTKLEEAFDWGFELISSTETMEATYTGRLLFRILASFAIYESDKSSARQSLHRITAFAKKRFEALGIQKKPFGYRVEGGVMKVVNSEARIIKFIYDKYMEIYTTSKGEKEKKEIYKEIVDMMSITMKQHLAVYLSESKRTTSEERLVEDILRDKKMISYSGMVKYEVEIKDALVEAASINTKSENKNELLWIRGSLQIGGSIQFFMFEPHLEIISQEIIDKVAKTRSPRFPDLEERLWLFDDLMEFSKDGKNVKANTSYKKDKKTFNYRGYIQNSETTLSEQIIEKKLLATKVMHHLEILLKDKERAINLTREVFRDKSTYRLMQLRAKKMAYERIIKQLEKQIIGLQKGKGDKNSKLSISEQLEKSEKEFISFQDALISVENEIQAILKQNAKIIDVMKYFITNKGHLSVRRLTDEEKEKRKLLYEFLFKRIILKKGKGSNKTLEFELRPEILEQLKKYQVKDNGYYEFILDKKDE